MKFPSEIKIAALPAKYLLEINRNEDGSTQIRGTIGKLIDLISSEFKFEYKLKIPSDPEFGIRGDDGNWTGLLGMMQRGEADVVFSIVITEERTEVVDFSLPYGFDDATFMVRKPVPMIQNTFFLKPFHLEIWLSIFVFLLFGTMITNLIVNSKISFLKILFHLYGTILEQPLTLPVKSSKAMAVFSLWFLSTFVLSKSYSTTLLSFLTVPFQPRPIRTFEELAVVVKEGKYKCLVEKGNSLISLMHKADLEHSRSLIESIEKHGWFVESLNSITAETLDSQTAVIGSRFPLQIFEAGMDSGLFEISEDVLMIRNFAIAFRKNFCCKKRFNTALSRALSGGLIQKFDKDMWNQLEILSKKTGFGSQIHHQITVSDLKTLLLMLLAGYIISFLVFLGEIAYYRLDTKKQLLN
ncbi:putative glutamate receptor [Araneus ventricosus]|uniref:Putative glutamate receptor n=1 Tax=Araneus ventricosus TaxID=182803 RepID=A0A4Y2F6Q4_ARAVE|nr:putative glutamate receptor [Araneus ventricosus]